MATKVRLEFLNEGFQAVLQSAAVQNKLNSEAATIAARAGEGFAHKSIPLGFGSSPRAGALVYTDDIEAMRAEAEDKSLSRAVGLG